MMLSYMLNREANYYVLAFFFCLLMISEELCFCTKLIITRRGAENASYLVISNFE